MALKSGLSAPVDQEPGKSPVFGTIRAILVVTGSVNFVWPNKKDPVKGLEIVYGVSVSVLA